MVSVTAAVQQMVRFAPAEASCDHVVRKNWVAAGDAAAQYQSLYGCLQMTGLASTHYLSVCVCVSEICGLIYPEWMAGAACIGAPSLVSG